MSAGQVVLWRHGRTAWNVEGRWQGHLDVPLDDVGRAQVEQAAGVLAARAPVALVSSDLSRASGTAAALAAATGLDVVADPALREILGGAWQGLLRAEIEAATPAEYAAWRLGDDVPAGGAERRSEAGQRVRAAVEEHAGRAADGATVVLVGHGGALGAGLAQLLDLPVTSSGLLTGLRNARWTTLLRGDRTGPRWRLLEHNAAAW